MKTEQDFEVEVEDHQGNEDVDEVDEVVARIERKMWKSSVVRPRRSLRDLGYVGGECKVIRGDGVDVGGDGGKDEKGVEESDGGK